MLFRKTGRISLASLIGAFLLIALPSLANIDSENITGMWLFNEGKVQSLLTRRTTETMVKSMGRSGSMDSSAKHLNLMVLIIGSKFRTQTLLGLKREHPSPLRSILKGPQLVDRLLAKTTRIPRRRYRGTCSGTVVPIVR